MPMLALQGVQEGLQDIRTDLVTPEHIAEELKAMGLVTGSLLAVHRLLDLTPFKVCHGHTPLESVHRLLPSVIQFTAISCHLPLSEWCMSWDLHLPLCVFVSDRPHAGLRELHDAS